MTSNHNRPIIVWTILAVIMMAMPACHDTPYLASGNQPPPPPPPATCMGVIVTVNSNADTVDNNIGDLVCDDGSGACTLRAAIQETNACIGSDIISIPAGTYTLAIAGSGEDLAATGDLDITDDLDITGSAGAASIIDGGGLDRVFHVPANVSTTVDGLTIQNGNVLGRGGGISAEASDLAISNSTLDSNAATQLGGGAYAFGLLTVTNSVVSNNTISNGDGGGVYGSSLSLTNSTVSGNTASDNGGGLRSGFDATISGSSIINNTALNFSGGGMRVGNALTMTDSVVSGNSSALNGGGIDAGGDVFISGSTISGNNAAKDGGGLVAGGTGTNGAIFANSTFSGNTSAGFNGGGGIWIAQAAALSPSTLDNVTISGNSASGLGAAGGGILVSGTSAELSNTIVANNPAGNDCGTAAGGTIVSNGHNIDDGNSCGFGSVGDLTTTDPLLGALADNGGPTQTHALQAGSPAIDAGDDAVCAAAPVNGVDQRGVARPQGLHCDIGAYEAP